MIDETEPDAATARAALLILFRGVLPEQHDHLVSFLLSELERLYVAARRTPPAWLGPVRQEFAGPTARPGAGTENDPTPDRD